MVQRINGKIATVKVALLAVSIVSLLALVAGTVTAQGSSYAFGYKWISNVRGLRINIWTGQRPSGLTWTASPVVICQDQYCNTKDFKAAETGWVDGTACWDNGCLGDVLQQYVTYFDANHNLHQEIGKGNLANDTWYQLKVLYSTSASRWEAWRGSNVVWFQPNLGWTAGSATVYGSEAAYSQNWMDVYGYYPEYKVGTGAW